MTEPGRDAPSPSGGSAGGPGSGGQNPGGARWRRFLPAVLLLAGLLVFFALGGQRYLNLETLRANSEALNDLVAAHGVLAMLVFVGAYAVVVAFSIPGGLVMTVTGGFLFGVVGGAVCSVIGATLGAIAVFLAARTALADFLRDRVIPRAGPAVGRMRAGFQENALSYLLVLRLIPLFPFWLVNLVPALLGVSLRVYIIGTVLGIIPASLVYAAAGNGLAAIFAAGETASIEDAILEPEVLLPILGLIALSLLPVIYKKVKGRKGPGS